MKRTITPFLFAALLALSLTFAGSPAFAQGSPSAAPLYTYVAEWGVPRAHWADMEKLDAADRTAMQALVNDGTLLGYGTFQNRVHSEGGYTHGSWFQASSMGNLLKALESVYSRPGGATDAVLAASKHQDYIMVSRVYGAKPVASNSTGYLRVISAQMQPGQADAFTQAFNLYIKPVYEKLLADGALVSYQLDFEFNVQNAPGRFFSAVVVRDAAALDKVTMAFDETFSKNPAAIQAILAALVPDSRVDILARVTAMGRK